MPPAADGCDAARRRPSVKTRTLANLSRWPEARIEALARVLKDEPVAAPGPLESGDRLEIERSWQVDVAEHRFGTVLALPCTGLASAEPLSEDAAGLHQRHDGEGKRDKPQAAQQPLVQRFSPSRARASLLYHDWIPRPTWSSRCWSRECAVP